MSLDSMRIKLPVMQSTGGFRIAPLPGTTRMGEGFVQGVGGWETLVSDVVGSVLKTGAQIGVQYGIGQLLGNNNSTQQVTNPIPPQIVPNPTFTPTITTGTSAGAAPALPAYVLPLAVVVGGLLLVTIIRKS